MRFARLAMTTAMAMAIAGSANADSKWPAADALLHPPAITSPIPKRPWRIYLDAGHGALGNTGAKSVLCEDEEDITLRIATEVAKVLESTHRFRVKLSRNRIDHPSYKDRIAAAEDFHAAVIVSIHTDARGDAHAWTTPAGATCSRNDTEPGLGVLMSDEGPSSLVKSRARFARSIARSVAASGFTLYGGADWMTLYAGDSEPGVFIDRRPKKKRVYLLRKPRIPSVIVETYHALDLGEDERWKEPRTIDAFAQALAAALDEALRAE